MQAALPGLKTLLTDEWQLTRENAAEGLLRMGDRTGVPTLRGLLDASYTTIALRAAAVLAEHGDTAGLPLARRHFAGDKPGLKADALKVLAFSDDPNEAYGALEKSLSDGAPSVQLTATNMLATLGTHRSLDVLAGAARNSQASLVRRYASHAIGVLGFYDGIPVLLDVLSGNDPLAASTAATALSRLSGRPWAKTIWNHEQALSAERDSREWWEANQERFPFGQKSAAPRIEPEHQR